MANRINRKRIPRRLRASPLHACASGIRVPGTALPSCLNGPARMQEDKLNSTPGAMMPNAWISVELPNDRMVSKNDNLDSCTLLLKRRRVSHDMNEYDGVPSYRPQLNKW